MGPTVNDIDIDDTLTISVVTKPGWLAWDGSILSGTPTNNEVGTHNVTLRVNDGTLNVDQIFVINVININDAPTFTSSPTTSINEGSLYSYTPTASDIDIDDTLTISVVVKPGWLSWNGSTLSGTPASSDVGANNVTLRVSDGTVNVDQTFVITVNALATTNIECLTSDSIVNVVSSNGNKYVLNNGNSYDADKKYGLGTGNYVLKNVSSGHPMALLNNGITNLISYIGDSNKKLTKVVNNVSYDFYYGDINVTVNGDFNELSIYCYYHGYMGGENLLKYSNDCTIQTGYNIDSNVLNKPPGYNGTIRLYDEAGVGQPLDFTYSEINNSSIQDANKKLSLFIENNEIKINVINLTYENYKIGTIIFNLYDELNNLIDSDTNIQKINLSIANYVILPGNSYYLIQPAQGVASENYASITQVPLTIGIIEN